MVGRHELYVRADGGRSEFTAFMATPKMYRGPTVVVLQEIFGVNDVMRDVCVNLAEQGFTAVCPDLFWRIQPNIQITDKTDAEWQKALGYFKAFDVNQGIVDVGFTLETLALHAACNQQIGFLGFCLGGSLSYLAACRLNDPRIKCAVSYYGVGIEKALEESKTLNVPTLMHIAEKDGFVPPPAQAAIKAALSKKPNVTIKSYPGCDHAFAREGGKSYRKEAAELANAVTLAFLKQHLPAVD